MKHTIALILFLLAPFAAGFIGSRFMPGEWYAGLIKPAWNPPSWIFGPMWTLLYILMGVSAWLVWRRAGFSGARVALMLFGVQLVFNGLWSWLFFGLHRPDLALIDIVILWLAIAAMTVQFARIHGLAAAMQAPYLAWVGFATFLNFTLWRLNGA